MLLIFLLYPACEFYWRWKQEYSVKTNNLLKITASLYHIMLYRVQFDRIENPAQYFVVIGELIETNERYRT